MRNHLFLPWNVQRVELGRGLVLPWGRSWTKVKAPLILSPGHPQAVPCPFVPAPSSTVSLVCMELHESIKLGQWLYTVGFAPGKESNKFYLVASCFRLPGVPCWKWVSSKTWCGAENHEHPLRIAASLLSGLELPWDGPGWQSMATKLLCFVLDTLELQAYIDHSQRETETEVYYRNWPMWLWKWKRWPENWGPFV